MANAKKCDRCGAFYESYDEKEDRKNTNSFMTLNIDLCPACNESLHEWFENDNISVQECTEEQIYPITDLYMGDFLDYFDILSRDVSIVSMCNSKFQSHVNRHLNCTPRLVLPKNTFFVLGVVYSVKNNTIKLCNFNDLGCTKPLTNNDILTAIKCYPGNASIMACIR